MALLRVKLYPGAGVQAPLPISWLSVAIFVLVVIGTLVPMNKLHAQTWTPQSWSIGNQASVGQPGIPAARYSIGNQPQGVLACPVIDTSGVGLPGYICPYVTNNGSALNGFISATNTGGGFTQSNFQSAAPPAVDYTVPVPSCYGGNFDGNGKRSVVCVVVSGPHVQNSSVLNYLGWYHASSYQSFSGLTTSGPSIGATNTSINQCLVLDINGDGRDDLICSLLYWPKAADEEGDDIRYTEPADYVYISTPQGFVQTSISFGPVNVYATYLNKCLVGDFNNDGLSDLACFAGSSSSWKVYYSEGTGNVPNLQEVDGSGPSVASPGWEYPSYPSQTSDDCVVADFNGDGRSDVACYQSNGTWSVGLATGNSSSPFTVQTWTGGPVPLTTKPHTAGGDCWGASLDGARIAGILCYAGTGGQWTYGTWSQTGNSFTTNVITTAFTPPPDQAPYTVALSGQASIPVAGMTVNTWCALSDLNGDGLLDIGCTGTENASGTVTTLLSSRPQ